jgi:Na+-translocating ferredoxin:NAD+ oxidoreductase subunit B
MTWTLPSAILFLLALLLLLGYFLSKKVFPARRDESQGGGSLQEIDCEGCGVAGCGGFAKALVRGGGEEGAVCARRIPGTVGEAVRAFVSCQGRRVQPLYRYSGAQTCKAAAGMQPRPLACAEACLGYGDCIGVCTVRAIRLRQGLAWIDPSVCTGCGECVGACPVGIIDRIPALPGLGIACSRPQGFAEDRPCLDGCTGCADCVRACPEGALGLLPDGLPLLDPVLCTRCGECVRACPQKVLFLVPLPVERKGALAGEARMSQEVPANEKGRTRGSPLSGGGASGGKACLPRVD